MSVIVFKDVAYCANAIAKQASRTEEFNIGDLVVPMVCTEGPLTVHQYEGKTHLILGIPQGDRIKAKVLSRMQLKSCIKEIVDARKNIDLHEPEVTRPQAFNRPYRPQGRRY